MHEASQAKPAAELPTRATERAKNIFVTLSITGSLVGLLVGIFANLMLK
jgi:hypothetical protein